MTTAEGVVLAAKLAELVFDKLDPGDRSDARVRLARAIEDESALLRETAQAALDAR